MEYRQSIVNKYMVSESGDILSLKTNKIMALQIHNKGYGTVRLSGKTYRIHRLVAFAFLSNPENLPQINHKDGDKLNNHYSNLEWCTAQHNIQHAVVKGLSLAPRGDQHYKTTLSKADAISIKLLAYQANVNEVAAKYGISLVSVYKIWQNENWKNVELPAQNPPLIYETRNTPEI